MIAVEQFLTVSGSSNLTDNKTDVKALQDAFNEVLNYYAPNAIRASSLLDDIKKKVRFLPTGCRNIDALLFGGVREGQVTEIYGESGMCFFHRLRHDVHCFSSNG